jgi:hypothetical protein
MSTWRAATERCIGCIDAALAGLDDAGRTAVLNALGERYQFRLEHIAEELGPMDIQNTSTLAEAESQRSEALVLLAEGLTLIAKHQLGEHFTDWITRVRALLARARRR